MPCRATLASITASQTARRVTAGTVAHMLKGYACRALSDVNTACTLLLVLFMFIRPLFAAALASQLFLIAAEASADVSPPDDQKSVLFSFAVHGIADGEG